MGRIREQKMQQQAGSQRTFSRLLSGSFAIAVTLLLSQPAPLFAAETGELKIWSFTRFDAPKSINQPARLTIGDAASKQPLLEASCSLGKNAALLPVTFYPAGEIKAAPPITLNFYRKNFKTSLKAAPATANQPGGRTAYHTEIPLGAELWTAMLAMKGIAFAVNDQPATSFTLVRGSEKRLDEFLANCRSRSVGINPAAKNDTIITRIFRCEDENTLTVEINVSGTTPKLTYSYKGANNQPLSPKVTGTGLIYEAGATTLAMQGPAATLTRDGKSLSCSAEKSP